MTKCVNGKFGSGLCVRVIGRAYGDVMRGTLQHTATHCNTLQHTATREREREREI